MRRIFLWVLLAVPVLGVAGFAAHRWHRSTRPEHRLQLGYDAINRADYDVAEKIVQQFEASGQSDYAHLLQAAIFLDLDRPNEAVSHFNQIESTDARLDGAVRYGEWLVRHHSQPVEAERLLRFVLSHRPEDVVAHRGLGAIYYDQGAWILAIQHLIRWSELDERDGRPLRFIGLIYKDMDQPTPAIASYRQALQRDLAPAIRQEVREELAECLTSNSHYAEALELLPSADQRGQPSPRLLALRGECLLGLSRPKEAAALVDQGLERAPTSLELLRLRGKLWLAEGKLQQAAAILERALQQDPHDTTSRYQLSLAYERLNRKEEAAKQRALLERTKEGMLIITKLIEEAGEKPWDQALHQRIAEQCLKMQRPDLARRWQRTATTKSSADPKGPQPQDPSRK